MSDIFEVNITQVQQTLAATIGDAATYVAIEEHSERTSGIHGISVFGASLVSSDDAGEAREILGFYDADNNWHGRNSFYGPVDFEEAYIYHTGAIFNYDVPSLASQRSALGITGSGVVSGLSHAVNAASGFVTFSGNIGAASGTSLSLSSTLAANSINSTTLTTTTLNAESIYADAASFDGIVEFGGESRFYGEAKFSDHVVFEWTANFTEPVVADSSLTVGGQTELLAQLATNGTSAMTRDLTRELAMTYPAQAALRYTVHPQIPGQAGVSVVTSGSALNQSSAASPVVIQCGATLNSSVVMRVGGFLNLTPGNRSTINFGRKILINSTIGSALGGTLSEARHIWPVDIVYSGGDPTWKAIGWKQVGTNLYGLTHDGTTLRLTSAFSFPNQHYAHTAIVGNGAGSYSFYVNGALLGTLAGPTGTVTINTPAIGFQAENKESGGNMYCVVQSMEITTYL